MEASVVVCEHLKPPRLCHTENQPKVRKTAPQKRARGARAVLCAVRAVRLFPPLARTLANALFQRKEKKKELGGFLRVMFGGPLRRCHFHTQ